jgi:hypothetical protein
VDSAITPEFVVESNICWDVGAVIEPDRTRVCADPVCKRPPGRNSKLAAHVCELIESIASAITRATPADAAAPEAFPNPALVNPHHAAYNCAWGGETVSANDPPSVVESNICWDVGAVIEPDSVTVAAEALCSFPSARNIRAEAHDCVPSAFHALVT